MIRNARYAVGMKEHYTTPTPSIPELLESLNAPQPTVIAFEGGPCGGKTTIVNRLAVLQDTDRPIVVVPEAATPHIMKLAEKGISIPDLAAHDREGFLALEADILQSIVTNTEETKQLWQGTNAIILTDRSDIGAYVTPAEYSDILTTIGRTVPPHLELVDKMVYLPSVAREDAARYTALMETNEARYESPEDAIATCVRNLGAVAMHPELSIYWGGSFETKTERVMDDVLHHEREVEAKYTMDLDIISYENAEYLVNALGRKKLGSLAIHQSYHNFEDHEFRLRHTMTEAGHSVYHYTVKTGIGDVRHEKQRLICPETYEALKHAPSSGELTKIRHRYLMKAPIRENGRRILMTADFYPERQLCQLELEGITAEETASIDLPGFYRGGMSAKELVQ